MTAYARLRTVGLGLALAVLIGSAAATIATEGQRRLTPAEIAVMAKNGAGAGTSGVVGIQTVVLKGDPSKRGLYTIILRVPAHTKIAAHRHPDAPARRREGPRRGGAFRRP